jgi:hypothetical protein
MRSDPTVAEQNQSVVRLKANSRSHYAAIAFVVASSSAGKPKLASNIPANTPMLDT